MSNLNKGSMSGAKKWWLLAIFIAIIGYYIAIKVGAETAENAVFTITVNQDGLLPQFLYLCSAPADVDSPSKTYLPDQVIDNKDKTRTFSFNSFPVNPHLASQQAGTLRFIKGNLNAGTITGLLSDSGFCNFDQGYIGWLQNDHGTFSMRNRASDYYDFYTKANSANDYVLAYKQAKVSNNDIQLCDHSDVCSQTISLPQAATNTGKAFQFTGLNYSGLEFSDTFDAGAIPNFVTTKVITPTTECVTKNNNPLSACIYTEADELNFYDKQNYHFNTMRVPIRWKYLQPCLSKQYTELQLPGIDVAGGSWQFNSTDFPAAYDPVCDINSMDLNDVYLNNFVLPNIYKLVANGYKVIVDLHSYMRYAESFVNVPKPYDKSASELLATMTKYYHHTGCDGHAPTQNMMGNAGAPDSGSDNLYRSCPDGRPLVFLGADANTMFTDTWNKINTAIKNYMESNGLKDWQNNVMYDLANEPRTPCVGYLDQNAKNFSEVCTESTPYNDNHNDSIASQQFASWEVAAAKSLIANKFTGKILVEGGNWSRMSTWAANFKNSGEPANNLAFTSTALADISKQVIINVHQYIDHDLSGTNNDCNGWGDSMKTALDSFNNYLQANKLQAIITEFAIPNSKDGFDILGTLGTSCDTNANPNVEGSYLAWINANRFGSAQNADSGIVGYTAWLSGHGIGVANYGAVDRIIPCDFGTQCQQPVPAGDKFCNTDAYFRQHYLDNKINQGKITVDVTCKSPAQQLPYLIAFNDASLTPKPAPTPKPAGKTTIKFVVAPNADIGAGCSFQIHDTGWANSLELFAPGGKGNGTALTASKTFTIPTDPTTSLFSGDNFLMLFCAPDYSGYPPAGLNYPTPGQQGLKLNIGEENLVEYPAVKTCTSIPCSSSTPTPPNPNPNPTPKPKPKPKPNPTPSGDGTTIKFVVNPGDPIGNGCSLQLHQISPSGTWINQREVPNTAGGVKVTTTIPVKLGTGDNYLIFYCAPSYAQTPTNGLKLITGQENLVVYSSLMDGCTSIPCGTE